MTNPSRPASNGREPRFGSSFRCESARIAVNPAMPTRVIGASVPPQNIASARPSRIASSPSPMAMLDAAQAVVSVASGPCVPSSIEIQAAAMLGMIWMIEKGLVRSGPRSISTCRHSSKACSPPMPVAIAAPIRSGAAATEIPLSFSAMRAAESASCEKRSILRACFRSIHVVGSKSDASHAKRTLYSLASKWVIGPAPDSPATRFSHVDSGSLPSGVTIPTPVTATRRLPFWLTSLIRLHPESAVHQEHRARDERRFLGAEEPYRSGHVLRVAEPAERRVLEHRAGGFLGKDVGQLGRHVARDDDVRPHVPAPELTREGLRESDDPGLGRSVVRLAPVPVQAHDRGDVHDRTRPFPHHRARDGSAGEEA